jgi:hypothetical protein
MHPRGGGGGHLANPLIKKLGYKNAIKHELLYPPRFSHNPKYPPQKKFAKKTQGPSPLDFQLLCIYAVGIPIMNQQ